MTPKCNIIILIYVVVVFSCTFVTLSIQYNMPGFRTIFQARNIPVSFRSRHVPFPMAAMF